MASKTDDPLTKTFTEASGGVTTSLTDVLANSQALATTLNATAEQLASAGPTGGGGGASNTILADALSQVVGFNGTQIENRTPSYSGSRSGSGSGGSGGTNAESIASTVLQSGLGLIPLVTGLLGLFGGGGSSTPPQPTKFALPAPISFAAADTGSGLSNVDYDQSGQPRVYDTPAAQPGGTAPANTSGNASGSTAAPQITVNVQAMDARSFMDYSGEIASAVRDAMLNLSSINDVVSEL